MKSPKSTESTEQEQSSLKSHKPLEIRKNSLKSKPIELIPSFKRLPGDFKSKIIRPGTVFIEWSKNKKLHPYQQKFKTENYYKFFREAYGDNSNKAKLKLKPYTNKVSYEQDKDTKYEENYGYQQIKNLKEPYNTNYLSSNDELYNRRPITATPAVYFKYTKQATSPPYQTKTSKVSYAVKDDDDDDDDDTYYNDYKSMIAIDETPLSIEINIGDNFKSLTMYDNQYQVDIPREVVVTKIDTEKLSGESIESLQKIDENYQQFKA